MPSNPIKLNLLNQVNQTTFLIGWEHLLDINNAQLSRSEKVDTLHVEFFNLVTGQVFETALLFYNTKQTTINTLTNLLIGIRLKLITKILNSENNYDRYTVYSNSITLDSRSQPTAPTNIRSILLSNGSIKIDWDISSNNGGAPLAKHYVQYSYNGGVAWFSQPVSFAPGVSLASYTFVNLPKNNSYIFRVVAENQLGLISPNSESTPPIYLKPSASLGDSILFDKSSWENNVNIPQNFKEYLTFAAEEWEKHIRMDPAVIEGITGFFPNFQGITLRQYIESPGANFTAACGPGQAVSINGPRSQKANAISFDLYINTSIPTNGAESMWRSILVHELGHALGFGIFWSSTFACQSLLFGGLGKDAIICNHGQAEGRYQLKGTFRAGSSADGKGFYPNAQKAYNELFAFNKLRGVMPLIWQDKFDEINKIAHWAYERNTINRFSSYHPPLPGDIMSYGSFADIPITQAQITPVTIGLMLDLGYIAIDGAPNIAAFVAQNTQQSDEEYSTVLSSLPEDINPNDISQSLLDNIQCNIELYIDANNKLRSATLLLPE